MKESAKGTAWVYQGVYPRGNNWSEGGRGVGGGKAVEVRGDPLRLVAYSRDAAEMQPRYGRWEPDVIPPVVPVGAHARNPSVFASKKASIPSANE